MVLFLLFISILFECSISLKLIELRVPTRVVQGTHATLSCRWQLGPYDVLYSLKWYKDGKEFFRHVPRDVEPRRMFLLPGVNVEEFNTTGSAITLAPATLDTEGRYRCEVSGEGPFFPTITQHADLAVVVLPSQGPVMSGLESKYHPGDRLTVNCISHRSRPQTNLTWYLNGEPLPEIKSIKTFHSIEQGLDTSSLSLDVVVDLDFFKNNVLKVKCLATIVPIYWRSIEETVVLDIGPQQIEKRNNVLVEHKNQLQANMAAGIGASECLVYLISCWWMLIYIYLFNSPTFENFAVVKSLDSKFNTSQNYILGM